MAKINAYLNFDGNTEEVFNFYKSVFGGEFTTFQRFADIPGTDSNIPEEDKQKLMHVALPIGDDVLMGSDIIRAYGHTFDQGNNFSLSVDTKSEAEAEQIFNALAAGGKITMPLEKTFWNAYFGMLTDKFGIQWMVNYDFK